MEYLDIYDEYMNKIGTETRDIVHQNGLWHKTVHCWMYDDAGNIYFQIREILVSYILPHLGMYWRGKQCEMLSVAKYSKKSVLTPMHQMLSH